MPFAIVEQVDQKITVTVDGSALLEPFLAAAADSAHQSADSATLAQAWAESPTAPGGAGTKSAKSHAADAAAQVLLAQNARTETEAARDVAVAAVSDVDGLEFPRFSTIASLLADTVITTSVTGRTWLGGGITFIEAASGATDHHVTTAGGIKLYVVPVYGPAKPVYEAAAFGITAALSGATLSNAINAALKKIPTFSILRLAAGSYVVARATGGTVLPSSAGTLGAIYIDKNGQELVGVGYDTHINGNSANLHCIVVRGDYCAVRNLRAGNVTGQLTTAEAAGVSIEPSNYPRVSPGGKNIENVEVTDCDFYLCETGVSAHPEAWGDLTATQPFPANPFTAFYRPQNIVVERCRFSQMYRHGVELFQCRGARVSNCSINVGAISGMLGSSTQRAIRVIGSSDVEIGQNLFTYTGVIGDGALGVEISRSGFYGSTAESEYARDVLVHNNGFKGFANDVVVEGSQGEVLISNNRSNKNHATGRFVRVTSSGSIANLDTHKVKVNKLVVTGNDVYGGYVLCRVNGAIDYLNLEGNSFVAQSVSNAYILEVDMAPYAASATISALERLRLAHIVGNVGLMNANAALAPIYIQNCKTGDIIHIGDGNAVVPSAAGRVITTGASGDVTVTIESRNAIRRLPVTAWSENFNPPDSLITDGAV